MKSVQEQQAEYNAFSAMKENVFPASFTIPMSHLLWIDSNWREMGFKNRSEMARAMVAEFIERHQPTE